MYLKKSKPAYNRDTQVQTSTIHSSQVMELAQVLNRRMDKVNRVHDKETVVYTHNGVLFSQKEE
jgi:predicted metal-binding transcription factor (methanogenesis marker protein 9)